MHLLLDDYMNIVKYIRMYNSTRGTRDHEQIELTRVGYPLHYDLSRVDSNIRFCLVFGGPNNTAFMLN